MNEDDIRAALDAHLGELRPAIPIVWQAKTPPKTFDALAAHAKAYWLPAANRTLGLREKTTRHSGIYQVSLCYPSGVGTGPARAQAVALQEHFPAGLVLTSNGVRVRVKGKPSIAAPTDYSPLTIPVSIRVESIF